MPIPPYFKQETNSSCSLAVLRMVLAVHGQEVAETELLEKIVPAYGDDFRNIWNPTIARLACEYGVNTTMYALWPLFKPELTKQAKLEFRLDPEHMDVRKYEHPSDSDVLPEPLSIAYRDMLQAMERGCGVVYGSLTERRLLSLLAKGFLIQTSVKLEKMYPGGKRGYHSLLVYSYDNQEVSYHDPYKGAGLRCSVSHLLQAANRVGACMAFAGLSV
jgi:hypothetical protein